MGILNSRSQRTELTLNFFKVKHHYRSILRLQAFSIACSFFLPILSEAKPVDSVARELTKSRGDAIVTLSVVMEMTMSMTGRPSQSKEQTVEVPGTIVSGEGWIVTSFSSIQPQLETPSIGGVEISVNNEIKEVRVIWANGEEGSAKIIYNDPERDVSIVQANDLPASLVTIDFASEEGQKPQVLDEVFLVSRQDESIDRALRVDTGRLSAIIDRPQQLFVTDLAEPGAPVFRGNGEMLGMCCWKRSEGQVPAIVVRPGAEILKVIEAAQGGEGEESKESQAHEKATVADLAAIGSEILENHGQSVVSIEAVIDNDGRTREQSSVGTVYGQDGFIVASRTGIARRGDIESIKILMADGTEVSAKMILEDLDLDLAFLLADRGEIDEQGLEFTSAPFEEESGGELEAVEKVLILTRESPAFFRQPKLIATHVDSVIEKPRRYYRTPEKVAGSLAFNVEGRLIGIYARRVNGEETRHRMILPSSHVVEAAKRARAAAVESDANVDENKANNEENVETELE